MFRCQLSCVRSRQQKSEESVIILKHTFSRPHSRVSLFLPLFYADSPEKSVSRRLRCFSDVDRCYPFAEHEKICDAPSPRIVFT